MFSFRMKLAAIAIVLAAAVAPAHAQSTASTTATAGITVIQPISIVNNKNMNFGTFVKPSSNTTVTLSNAGVISGLTAVNTSGNAPSQAQFTITGEGGQAINITVPGTVALTGTGGSLTVTLTADSGTTGSAQVATLSGAIGSAGTKVVNVGGTVPLTATTASGAYSGTFTVTAAYQ